MHISVLGQNIKKIRKEKGISAYKLSKLAGVGISTISEIETGKRQSLNSLTIDKVAKALDVKIDDLLTEINFNINNESLIVEKNIDKLFIDILSIDGLMLDGEVLNDIELAEIKFSINVILEIVRAKKKGKKE